MRVHRLQFLNYQKFVMLLISLFMDNSKLHGKTKIFQEYSLTPNFENKSTIYLHGVIGSQNTYSSILCICIYWMTALGQDLSRSGQDLSRSLYRIQSTVTLGQDLSRSLYCIQSTVKPHFFRTYTPGAKIEIYNAPIKHGVLVLTPVCAKMLGGFVYQFKQ